MKDDIADLANRLADCEEKLRLVMEKGASDIQESLERAAERNAAFESFCSLLDFVGADKPGFVTKYQELKKVWLDRLLTAIQNRDPGVGASLDTREISDIPTLGEEAQPGDGPPPPWGPREDAGKG